ncbi:GNAT family N-acetyltransferase [Streptomyces sp. NPDC002573]|uniref:GNAT family N-acetyltransferase n=1 Tax=Streptomyces sp. NPDC002573 TaxID=3364651 RepID=UPI00368245AF
MSRLQPGEHFNESCTQPTATRPNASSASDSANRGQGPLSWAARGDGSGATEYALAVIERETGELIGFGHLATDPHQQRAATMGFALRPDARGVGYGVGTVRLLLTVGFDDLGDSVAELPAGVWGQPGMIVGAVVLSVPAAGGWCGVHAAERTAAHSRADCEDGPRGLPSRQPAHAGP